MKGFVTILLCWIISTSIADEKKSSKNQTQKLMQSFLLQLTHLREYMVSEKKFTDKKNHEVISTYLKTFADLVKKTQHDPTLNQENFKFSRYVLEEHAVDIEKVFRLGNKSYARKKLAATISVCMSCHTQLPTESKSFTKFNNLKSLRSDFDKAEFLFATRSFDQASILYDKLILKNNDQSQVEEALAGNLFIMPELKRDPAQALSVFKRYQEIKKLPKFIQESLASWIKQLENWQKETTIDPKTVGEKEIIKFAEAHVKEKFEDKVDASNPNLVNYLHVSGILFEYLQHHPNSQAVPEVLYWLSVCDRSTSNTLFYSLADLYLRECIIRYPEHKIAKKCYKEYEAETVWGYTGSLGTDLPSEVKSDLDRLKKLVDSEGKIDLQRN